MRVWKVVRKDGGQLVSAVAYGSLEVSYGSEWAEAPVGGLLAFRNPKSAKDFLREVEYEGYEYEIWEAEGRRRIRLAPDSSDDPGDLETAAAFWSSNAPRWKWAWPKGTVAFKRMRLVKKHEG